MLAADLLDTCVCVCACVSACLCVCVRVSVRIRFSSVRVPHKEIDTLKRYDSGESKHFVVLCNGVYYSVLPYKTLPSGKLVMLTSAELQLVRGMGTVLVAPCTLRTTPQHLRTA